MVIKGSKNRAAAKEFVQFLAQNDRAAAVFAKYGLTKLTPGPSPSPTLGEGLGVRANLPKSQNTSQCQTLVPCGSPSKPPPPPPRSSFASDSPPPDGCMAIKAKAKASSTASLPFPWYYPPS
ncbi:hypothetical protein [[Phormidium] sp. ETS-05]|uniref:hypothetical protein n=1 Tax=[Phormidium] sp. ETS-05 TaxID=222819 RepID=UPI001E52460B|nr:hypothetical protein [[Phormidium] sp. ETS-05]